MRARLIRRAGAVIALALVAAVPTALASVVEEVTPQSPAPSAETGEATPEVTDLWFVELSSAPVADGTSVSTINSEQNAFRQAARRAGVDFSERFAFKTLWNGLSIKVDPSKVGTLATVDGVKAVYPVAVIQAPETSTVSPDLATALAMTGADNAQSELGYTGEGVKVAIMDTGVDYNHPDLGGSGTDADAASNDGTFDGDFPNDRVVAGHDFVGSAFNADPASPAYNPVPVPDPDPDDCNSHGTHVAGIVGADGDPATGGALGVAPGVDFGAYRVFGCGGSTTADIMIAAMERALADGMDVLNMSIGSAFQWPQYPTGAASDRLVNAGVSVVASIGNSGASGVYSAGSPGLGKKVIGVASFDNTHIRLRTFTVSPDDMPIGYANASAAPPAPTMGSLPMAKTGTPTTVDDGCVNAPAPGTMAGKAVLIRRGTSPPPAPSCGFYQKALAAQNAGAAAVVIYNNVAGRFSPTVAPPNASSPAITIPVVAISDTEGVLINNRLNAGPVTMTWTANEGTFVNPTGGLISSFSSYGLSPDLALKPDIGGPGGLIRSTYPLELGSYATISGTSMAAPHVAGAVALLLEAKPNTPSNAIRSILQNTSEPKNWWGNPALGLLDNVHRQGAGMVQIDDAIVSTTKVEPGKLELGESEAGPQTRTLAIENNAGSAVTYDLSHSPALSTGPKTSPPPDPTGTFTPSFFTGFASVAFSQLGVPVTSVTVPAGGVATVDVTVTANSALANRSVYGGYVVLTPQGGGQTYRVPYAGFKGDYQGFAVMTSGGAAVPFPKMAKQTGFVSAGNFTPTYAFTPTPLTYDMQSKTAFGRQFCNCPNVAVHLDHQASSLTAEVFRVSDGLSVGKAFVLRHVPRNSTSTGFFAFQWDGKVKQGKNMVDVADGDYYIVVKLVRPLGDAANAAHVETATLGNFAIDRP